MRLNKILVAVCVSLSASAAYAQEPNGLNSGVEVIQVMGTYFNNYEVDKASGAMRQSISLLDTAQSVTVIPEVIDEQLATTLGEVLNNDASLTPGSKQRNREVFSLRGFQLSSSTGYLRDGHQHWSHYQQPIETLQRVEVIKGPSSVLYGQSAPGGLINMVTKQPTKSRMFDWSADIDQYGSTRFMLDAGGELFTNTGYRAVLVKQDVDYEREYQNDEQRERDRFLGSIVLEHQLTDNFNFNVYYDRTNDKAGLDTGSWLNNEGDLIGNDSKIYDFSWAFTDISVENIGTKLSYFINPNWSVKVGYNEQTFERQRFESAPRKPSDYVQGDSYTSRPYDRFDDWQFRSAYIDVNGEFNTGGINHQLLIGANTLDYYYGQLRTRASEITYIPGQSEPTRPNISYTQDDSLYTSEYDYYGVYLQDLISVNDQWQLAIGGRFDKQSREGADNESFVPKVGVLYHPIEDATVYLSYSEGFEPQGSETLNEERDKNNGMTLDAVTSEQIELGAKWQITDRLLIDGALFNIEKSGNLISESIIGDPDFDTITTQTGLQRHRGIELSAQGAVNDKFFVMASTMFLDAQYSRDDRYQGNEPMDTPKVSASLWSRYELNEDFAFNAGVFYLGKRFADNDNTVSKNAYFRVDFGATYSLKVNDIPLGLRFNVENVLDKDYLGGGGLNNVAIGDGIAARFEIKARL